MQTKFNLISYSRKGNSAKEWDILTKCGLVTTEIWVSIGTGSVLLPDDTKPLPEPV